MKANIIISSYIEGRYNNEKLRKLKEELEKNFEAHKTREHQSFPEEGLEVTIGMSAKYGTTYVKCEGWGDYLSVGEFENIIKDSLENRGFEIEDEEGEGDHFKIWFE